MSPEPHRTSAWWLLPVLLLSALHGSAVDAQTLQRVRLQLKWLHQFQFAGYYAAQAKGFYRREGLDVQILEGSPSRPPAARVLTGRAEFGVNMAADVLHDRLSGAPLVALAVIFQHSPAVVVTRKRDGLRRPRDLIGHSLMLTREQGEADLLAMFRHEGVVLDADPATSVSTRPHSWRHRDLASGRVDAFSGYLTTEPWALRREGVDVDVMRPVEYGIDFYGDTLFTSEDLVASSPELVKRFVRASLKGWTYAMRHPDEIADLIVGLESARATRPTHEALVAEAEAMRPLVLSDLVELGHMNPGRWKAMARELRALGLVEDTRRTATIVPRPPPSRLWRWLALGAGGVILLSALGLLWVVQLRRQVRRRTGELRQSLQTNRAIIAGIPDRIFVNRRDGAYLEAHVRSPGPPEAPPGSLLGKTPHALFTKEIADALAAAFVRAIDEDRTQLLEYPSDGRVFEARVMRLDADRALSIVRDVTSEREVRERLTLLAAAIQQAAEDVIITDADSIIRYVNPSFERSTGYTAAEVLGKTPSFLRSGQHSEEFYREMWATLASGRPWHGRFHNRTKDGRILLQDATIGAIHDAAGTRTGFVSTRNDVTERVEMEAHLAQSQRLQAIGELAGGIAHDFNNILTVIMTNAELAQAMAGTSEELESILAAGQRASDLVKQILSFSRHVSQQARPLRLSALVSESLRFLRATLPSVEITAVLASEAMVRAEPGELQRVIVNLCTNAAVAMRGTPGVLELRIDEASPREALRRRTDGLDTGSFVRLTVKDNGCGMSERVKARIFEPFFTTRLPGEGTGLGLFIVHGIVQRMGGAIEVQSALGQGTTFEVYLPTVVAEPQTDQAPAATAERGAGRIIIVDDEPLVARALDRRLSLLGYTVRAFTRGAEALAAVESDPWSVDVVVTDLAMPQLAGDALARKLRALRADLPIVVCTGNRENLSDDDARRVGATEVIEKPIDIPGLSAMLKRLTHAP